MLIWALAIIVLVLTWGSVLLLRVMEVEVPMSIPLIVTVVTVAAVLGWIAWRMPSWPHGHGRASPGRSSQPGPRSGDRRRGRDGGMGGASHLWRGAA